jgi:hypothetical protein|tara:strand:+ start:651 stop:866 length:216 start_codon:yes stop_codon:yes gene_type:complete
MSLSKEVRLIIWPWSQICIECPHGQFVDIAKKPSAYLCHYESTDNPDTIPLDCPDYLVIQSTKKELNYDNI